MLSGHCLPSPRHDGWIFPRCFWQICSPGHDLDIRRASLKYISSWYGGCRSAGYPLDAPTQIGLSVRKPARQRVCTHVRAVPRNATQRHATPRDSSPCGINQVKKTCRKVLTLGSAHPACCVPSRIPERVKLCPRPPLSRVPETPCTPKGSSRLDLLD